ncbi:MAG: T9SS type A sorting domain-containing protein, partial [Proteobacteria bacterium]|nr:T9SS type A sorting domain-containing protein [Pseudomonadota bacterium]
GFEAWTGDTLNVWNVDDAVNIAKESTDVYSGAYAIKITTTSSSNRGVWQQISITGGEEYIYSVWMKGNGTGSNGMGILVTWRGSDGGYISNSSTKYNSDSLVWEHVCDTVIAPDTAAIADLKIRGYMDNGYAGIADDADFESVTGIMRRKSVPDEKFTVSYIDQTIKINTLDKISVTIDIFDMAGNLRQRKEIVGNGTVKATLDKGVYFVVARAGHNEVVKKVVVFK